MTWKYLPTAVVQEKTVSTKYVHVMKTSCKLTQIYSIDMLKVNFRSYTKIAVNVSEDKGIPSIDASFVFPDGTILLMDAENRCLKRVSPGDLSVTERLPFQDSPKGLVVFNETLVFVHFLFPVKRYAIVSVQETMQLTEYKNCPTPCLDQYEQLCLSDETEFVPFKDISKHIYASNSPGIYYLNCKNHIEQSYDLRTVDLTTGKELWKTKLNTSDPITGFCVDDCGTIFTLSNNKIQQYNKVGLKISEIPLVNDGSSLSIDTIRSKMIVTYRNENYIDLISIEKTYTS